MLRASTIALAASIATSTAAHAQTTIYRDSAGRIVGQSRESAMPFSNDSTQFYDAQGRSAGSITHDGFGGHRVYDDAGRQTGTINED